MRVAAVTLLLSGLAATGGAQTEQTREMWQRVPDLFASAHAHRGATIADVGAGDGFLTVRLATAVGPRGRVYAVDTDKKVARGLRARVAGAAIKNVQVVDGAEASEVPVAGFRGSAVATRGLSSCYKAAPAAPQGTKRTADLDQGTDAPTDGNGRAHPCGDRRDPSIQRSQIPV